MVNAFGYILSLEDLRLDAFRDSAMGSADFSEPVPYFKHSHAVPLLCFIIEKSHISYICLGKSGRKSGTGLLLLHLTHPEKLDPPIALDEIISRLPFALRNAKNSSLNQRILYGGLLTNDAFYALLHSINSFSPACSELLSKYTSDSVEKSNHLTPKIVRALASQKEALLTALAIADIDREVVQDWTLPSSVPTSFLDNLPQARLREDQMIVHDLMKIPGFDFNNTPISGSALFTSGTKRLTIVLANRLPLEKQTGTDLIYYNESFKSFIMVQYRLFRSSSG